MSNTAAKGRPGFYFLACPDVELVLGHVAETLQKFPAPAGQWGKLVFWGDESPPADFWQNLNQGGLFGSCRAIIVRRANEWPAAVWKAISPILGQVNENVFPIFCLENAWEKGKPKFPACIAKSKCLEFAEKKGWIWKNPGLTPSTIGKYVDVECKKLGLAFTPEARQFFCSSVMPDAFAIGNELQKLALANQGEVITSEKIALGSANPEADAFECIKKLETGNLAAAWKELSKSSETNMVFYLVALIAREMRILWQINNGVPPWMPADALTRKKQILRRIGLRGIEAGFSAALDAEWSVKKGQLSPLQALEKLMYTMASIYGNKGAQKTAL